MTGGRGGRSKQLLDLRETRGYWKLEEEVVYCTVWRTGTGGGCGPDWTVIGTGDVHREVVL